MQVMIGFAKFTSIQSIDILLIFFAGYATISTENHKEIKCYVKRNSEHSFP